MKSSFTSDLLKEKKLSELLDTYYHKYLKHYLFERITSKTEQLQGIDLILKHKETEAFYNVDEKAQLDYINDSLPTFAFELFYEKDGETKQGWFFDTRKRTHFYTLVTSIYADEENVFTSCNIMFVNREKLIGYLASKGYTKDHFANIVSGAKDFHGKMELERLHPKNEGFVFFSRSNKAEKPVNLVLKLDFLLKMGVAKKLV